MPDASTLIAAILHADYDDGFVAYLNGTEIGRSMNLGEPGTFVPYDEATSTDHEAHLYWGGYPEVYFLDSSQLASLLTEGENVLAVQAHNVGITSSDMSSNFFLSFGIADESTYYGPTPGWFQPPFVFDESNIPIVMIDTFGEEIPDDYRIVAHMGIIDNGTGINHIDDPFNGYDGQISIEIRGSSSQMFPKKQYALETQDSDGENLNIPILGMPAENDWILYAPYSDKSLLRNFLAYELAREMGWYSSRTRFCELAINGDYKGLYIFMEKIKRDNNRVDISKLEPDETSGDDLTGGYILKVDKWDGENNDGWWSDSPLPEYDGVWYQYHYPEPDDIVEEQRNYINNYITNFELLIASESYNDPDAGYYDQVNLESFIDVSLMSEISKNVDAYRLSAYMYKDKDSEDGRLTMGPIWDYNLAFGNADYYEGWDPAGWQMDVELGGDGFKIPFWWYRIWDDETFTTAFNQRWQGLRQTIFSFDHIMNTIDSAVAVIGEAQDRNFQRWPILNEYVWPNAYVGGSYESELDYLKNWITDRLDWMDQQTIVSDEMTVDYFQNWNLIGVPFESNSFLCQGYVEGSLYSFENGSYVNEIVDNMSIGSGYWLRFEDDETCTFSGFPINETTLTLTDDWNLIGSISSFVNVNTIIDENNLIIPGTIYGFEESYFEAETIEPGYGYWLRSSGEGEITISSSAPLTKSINFQPPEYMNTLTFIRSGGLNNTSLYFSNGIEIENPLSYSLPPKPPAPSTDIRFSGNTKLCSTDECLIEVVNDRQPLAFECKVNDGESWELIPVIATRQLLDEVILLMGENQITLNSNVEQFILRKSTSPQTPTEFVLFPAHPNPFNPVTILRYVLPEDNFVMLTVYDMLGRRVVQLVNTTQEAGYRSVHWNATDKIGRPVSAGVYLYQIQAGEFVQTRKMVLLR